MNKPANMSSREYYHYKRLNNIKRYRPLAESCQDILNYQRKFDVKKIVDLGSSCGPLLKELEAIYNDIETFGVDVSDYAEKHWDSKGIFIKSDLNKIDNNIINIIGENSVDIILSFETAEHLHSIDDLVLLISKLSKKDSTLIFGAATPLQLSSKGHVSCFWPHYWIDKFQSFDWIYDHLSSMRFSNYIALKNSMGNKVPLYYLNSMIFRRKDNECWQR